MLNPAKTKGTTLADVRAVELVKPPNAGRDWAGIHYGEMVKRLEKTFKLHKLEFSPVAAAVGRHGLDCALGFVLERAEPKLPKLPEGWRYGFGLANSNSGRAMLRVYLGAYRWDAEERLTSVVTNRFRSGRRYAHTFVLADELRVLVDRWHKGAESLGERLTALAEVELQSWQASELVVGAVAKKLTPGSRGLRALANAPRWSGGAGYNGLGLVAAFGETAGLNPAMDQQDQMFRFCRAVKTALLPTEVKVPTPTEE